MHQLTILCTVVGLSCPCELATVKPATFVISRPLLLLLSTSAAHSHWTDTAVFDRLRLYSSWKQLQVEVDGLRTVRRHANSPIEQVSSPTTQTFARVAFQIQDRSRTPFPLDRSKSDDRPKKPVSPWPIVLVKIAVARRDRSPVS